MKRREFVKTVPLTALVPATLIAAQPANAQTASAETAKVTGQTSSGASGTGTLPDYAGKILHSDMDGLGPDGTPIADFKATFSGHSRADAKHDPNKPYQMPLTKEEQDIMNGSKWSGCGRRPKKASCLACP